MAKTTAYFAYGSNMDKTQMAGRCPDAEFCGNAVLPDYKFALDAQGVATVIPCKGYEVRGCIWSISERDEANLDYYEGVSSGCYTKEILKVCPEDYVSELPVLIYVSARGKNDGLRRGGYMERIVDAAQELGFDNSYLGMLKDIWVGYANEDVREIVQPKAQNKLTGVLIRPQKNTAEKATVTFDPDTFMDTFLDTLDCEGVQIARCTLGNGRECCFVHDSYGLLDYPMWPSAINSDNWVAFGGGLFVCNGPDEDPKNLTSLSDDEITDILDNYIEQCTCDDGDGNITHFKVIKNVYRPQPWW